MRSVIDKLMNQQATLALAGSGAIILSKQCYKNRFKTVSPNLQPQTILFQVVTSQNKWGGGKCTVCFYKFVQNFEQIARKIQIFVHKIWSDGATHLTLLTRVCFCVFKMIHSTRVGSIHNTRVGNCMENNHETEKAKEISKNACRKR